MNLLRAEGVWSGYGATSVIQGASLSVDEGELWAVLGPNGAGKSTFLGACVGLRPLLRGHVEVLGAPLGTYRADALARVVAWVPQRSDPPGAFTGLELVLMGRAPHLGAWGLPGGSDVRIAQEALDALQIGGLAARRCTELSGGEQRLLGLARALAQRPKLLFLDEPTAFLDLSYQVQVLSVVRAQVRTGLGVAAVFHDVNFARSFATHALLLKGGRVMARGPVEEVLQEEALSALYGVAMREVPGAAGIPMFQVSELASKAGR